MPSQGKDRQVGGGLGRGGCCGGQAPGGGRRPYGYTTGTYERVPFEASVVATIYRWFLAGRSLTSIAAELNQLKIVTAYGNAWTSTGVARIVDAPRYAALRVRRGQVARTDDGAYQVAAWPACVSVADWEAARALRTRPTEAEAAPQDPPPPRYYALTGLVDCGACGRSTVGSPVSGFPTYGCTGNNLVAPDRCSQHISAARLENLVDQRIVLQLENLTPSASYTPASAVLDEAVAHRRAKDQERLRILQAQDGCRPKEVATVLARIREANRQVVVRTGDALEGVETGKRAGTGWHRLPASRREEVRRFLIAKIRIGARTAPHHVFDPERVEIAPNPL